MRSRTREWRCMDTPHAVEARCVASRARNGHRTAVRLHRVPAEVATAHAPCAAPCNTVNTFPSCSTVIPRTNKHTLPSCAIHDRTGWRYHTTPCNTRRERYRYIKLKSWAKCNDKSTDVTTHVKTTVILGEGRRSPGRTDAATAPSAL